MNSSPILQATDIRKQYKNGTTTDVLSAISFSVYGGEFISITGPSGSGKTTLLNIMGTLDFPSSGSLTIAGESVSKIAGDKLSDFRRNNIGFVFQLFNLIPTLTSLENVMLPLIPYAGAKRKALTERAASLLEKVGLGSRLTHLPGQLSGGERQRVAIARALINNSNLILADEPTGNLDSKSGVGVLEILTELNQSQGKTVIIVTHDPNIASRTDRTILLQDGQIKAVRPNVSQIV